MEEVRLAVQRAIDKLINRFGTTSEVLDELRHALDALNKASVKETLPTPPVVEPESGSATSLPEEGSTAESEAEPRPQTRKRMGRSK